MTAGDCFLSNPPSTLICCTALLLSQLWWRSRSLAPSLRCSLNSGGALARLYPRSLALWFLVCTFIGWELPGEEGRVGMCLELSGGFCGLGQAIMAESNEHALSLRSVLCSTARAYSIRSAVSFLQVLAPMSLRFTPLVCSTLRALGFENCDQVLQGQRVAEVVRRAAAWSVFVRFGQKTEEHLLTSMGSIH